MPYMSPGRGPMWAARSDQLPNRNFRSMPLRPPDNRGAIPREPANPPSGRGLRPLYNLRRQQKYQNRWGRSYNRASR
jgi:hypothetical protein